MSGLGGRSCPLLSLGSDRYCHLESDIWIGIGVLRGQGERSGLGFVKFEILMRLNVQILG